MKEFFDGALPHPAKILRHGGDHPHESVTGMVKSDVDVPGGAEEGSVARITGDGAPEVERAIATRRNPAQRTRSLICASDNPLCGGHTEPFVVGRRRS